MELHRIILAISALIFGVAFSSQLCEGTSKQIPLANEQEVKVRLNAGYAYIFIAQGPSSTLLNAEVEKLSAGALEQCITYSLRDKVGYITIDTKCDEEKKSDGKRKKHFSGWRPKKWNFEFSDAVPLDFNIEIGFGKGVLDLTGLSLKDFDLSSGASSVLLKFEKPNKSTIEDFKIEAGVGKFRAEGLCYANFNHLRFEGGVGSYHLDFGGTLKREVDVDLDLGLGVLTAVIPYDIGVKVNYRENFLSPIDLDADFTERENGVYYSSNYENAQGRINIHIEAGLGVVKIKRK